MFPLQEDFNVQAFGRENSNSICGRYEVSLEYGAISLVCISLLSKRVVVPLVQPWKYQETKKWQFSASAHVGCFQEDEGLNGHLLNLT